MTLWRAAKNASGGLGQAERVLKNGNPAPQPTWTDNSNGTWTFTYSDLPAANANDQDYVYWAVESAGSGNTDGFYPVYGVGDNQSSSSHGGSGTVIQESGSADGDDLQTNEIITNTATKLSLDKISNWLMTTRLPTSSFLSSRVTAAPPMQCGATARMARHITPIPG